MSVDTSSDPVLVATDVNFSFGPFPAVRSASLSLDAGECVALVGPSGCGKSTVLMCLAGVLVPQQGSVALMGRRIDNLDDGKRTDVRANSFGFVMQFGHLVPELQMRENVALPQLIRGRRRTESLSEADQLMSSLGIGEVGHRLPGEVSGGQRQRAAVARALMGSPTVIFADEPTGALDSVNSGQVMRLLLSRARIHNAAVMVVTHESAFIGDFDRVMHMRDGVVLNEGP